MEVARRYSSLFNGSQILTIILADLSDLFSFNKNTHILTPRRTERETKLTQLPANQLADCNRRAGRCIVFLFRFFRRQILTATRLIISNNKNAQTESARPATKQARKWKNKSLSVAEAVLDSHPLTGS